MNTLLLGTAARTSSSISLEQIVPPLHRPASRHQDVEIDEPPRARLAGPERVKAHAVPFACRARISVILRCRSSGIAVSSSPSSDRRRMFTPVRTMLIATRMAMIGSSRCQPVIAAAVTPTMTPAEVHTSLIR